MPTKTRIPRGASMRITRRNGLAVQSAEMNAPAEAEVRGAAWEGTVAFLDQNTDEMFPRLIDPAGVTFNSLPMPLMAMFEDDHGTGGDRTSILVGRIEAYEVVGDQLKMRGTFDPTPEGARGEEWAAAGTARVSVDTNPMEYRVTAPAEVVEQDAAELEAWLDGETQELPVTEDGRVIIEEGKQSDYIFEMLQTIVMGVTMVPFSAFADAMIGLVAGGGVLSMVRIGGDIGRMAIGTPEGAMLAVYPDDPSPFQIGSEYAESPEQLHVTIAAPVSGLDGDRLETLARELAYSYAPISGTVTGICAFAEGDLGVPVVAMISAPGLNGLNHDANDGVADMGGEVATEYGYACHLTLAYVPAAEVAGVLEEAMTLVGTEVTFSNLATVNGEQREDFPLAGLEGQEPGLTASAAHLVPVDPPRSWFDNPEFDEPTPLHVSEDGRVSGHIFTWGQCHTGFPGQCKQPPASPSNYAWFKTSRVLTAEGEMVWTGPITLGTDHPDTFMGADEAQKHYADTGWAVADVTIGEDEIGAWISGALRPDCPAEKVRALRGSTISPDWRWIDGDLETVGLLAVNGGGYPIPQPAALVADGQVRALVASGMLRPEGDPAWHSDPAAVDRRLSVLVAKAEGVEALATLANGGTASTFTA